MADFLVSYVFGYSPIFIKIAGTKSENAYMSLTASELDLYSKKQPIVKLGDWQNLAPARTAAVVSLYSPLTATPVVEQPVLLLVGEKDDLCPAKLAREAIQQLSRGRLLSVDATHFEIYEGEAFETVMNAMVDFLHEVVPLSE
jgi:fermentation-respiration switch protein FrsA (DUF1100 family)